MEKVIYPKEFEKYWSENRDAIIKSAPCVLREERANNGKMNTAGDWLLFIVPMLAGIGFFNTKLITSEMVNFLVGLAIVVVCYVVVMLIRPYVTGKRSIADIDADIKAYAYTVYEKEHALKS